MAFVVSVGALRNWLKVIVLGSLVEALRRAAMYLYYAIPAYFWITADFYEDDDSYGSSLNPLAVRLRLSPWQSG